MDDVKGEMVPMKQDEELCSMLRKSRWLGRLEGAIAILLPISVACVIVGLVMR